MSKRLFIVATPIGNLQDITIRAIDTLFSVKYILSEQPEKTRNLLNRISKEYPFIVKGRIVPKVIIFNEFVENEEIHNVINIFKEEIDVAVVSEAGMPLISDPGYKLVQRAIKEKWHIVCVPGASAVTASLATSGLPSDKFIFLGFLSKSKVKRENFLLSLKEILKLMQEKQINPTVIFFESPHRLFDTLVIIEKVYGNANLILVREQTKIFEEIIRNNVSNLIEKYKKNLPKGEFTILFNLK